MKIVVIEGENISQSRQRLETIVTGVKKKGMQIKYLQKDLKNNLQNVHSLFNENMLYILEKPTLLAKTEFLWFQKNHSRFESSLLIYQENSLPQTIKKFLPKETKVEKFEVPKYIFKFLESFYPPNSSNCLSLFHQTIEKQNPEFVLALLARHLKDLYISLINSKNLPYPAWRISKIRSQSTHFTPKIIKTIVSDLAKADIKSKTGGVNLTTSLDLIISKDLISK